MAKGTEIRHSHALFTQTLTFWTRTTYPKIETICRFINNKDFKHLATNMIDSFQLASGISIRVLENKKWKIKYVNSTWTTSLVQELQQCNIQLKVQSTFKLTKQRRNDSNIMGNELTNNDQLSTALK